MTWQKLLDKCDSDVQELSEENRRLVQANERLERLLANSQLEFLNFGGKEKPKSPMMKHLDLLALAKSPRSKVKVKTKSKTKGKKVKGKKKKLGEKGKDITKETTTTSSTTKPTINTSSTTKPTKTTVPHTTTHSQLQRKAFLRNLKENNTRKNYLEEQLIIHIMTAVFS